MSERAEQLHATADRQIADLINLISTLDRSIPPAGFKPAISSVKGNLTLSTEGQDTAP